MRIFNTVFCLLIFSFSFCQNLIVNKQADYRVSTIKYSINDNDSGVAVFDIIKNDTVTVVLGKGGMDAYIFKLQITDNLITSKISKWTDYPMYDGKHSMELEIKSYDIEINKTSFAKGDTIKGKFKVVTEPNKYVAESTLIGEIHHIIGGNLYKWTGSQYWHDTSFKNGVFVKVKQEEED